MLLHDYYTEYSSFLRWLNQRPLRPRPLQTSARPNQHRQKFNWQVSSSFDVSAVFYSFWMITNCTLLKKFWWKQSEQGKFLVMTKLCDCGLQENSMPVKNQRMILLYICLRSVASDYVRLMKYADSLYRCKQLKRAALGRWVDNDSYNYRLHTTICSVSVARFIQPPISMFKMHCEACTACHNKLSGVLPKDAELLLPILASKKTSTFSHMGC